MELFVQYIFALIFLFLVSVIANLISKRLNFPYTVLLVLFGILLIPLQNISLFSFLKVFELTPELLFFVFLPILLFESGYNIKYRQLKKDWIYIFALAVVGLLISTFLIAIWMYYVLNWFGWNVPFEFCLLFGALISATDPVAVLALFKEVWAPKRLALLFEGESLFNDWTALAVFLIILEAIQSGVFDANSLLKWVMIFLVMVLGGLIYGSLVWVTFSKLLEKIKDNEHVEITITMIMATFTFVSAEFISEHLILFGFDIKISAIIATAIAAIIMWNYGWTKISPKVERYMNKFWSFFAFLANSLVFLSLWLILSKVNVPLKDFIWPIFITIGVVIIVRAVSVYIPINIVNFFQKENKVPFSWQHLLAWWSLRWALALMMALMIPESLSLEWWNYNFSIKDGIIAITISSIMFTLFIKWLTIKPLIWFLWIDKLYPWEKFEKEEASIIVDLKLLSKLEKLFNLWIIHQEEYEYIKDKIKIRLNRSIEKMKKLLSEFKNPQELLLKTFTLHALGIEKKHLKDLFMYGEIDEFVFKYLLNKIDSQIERLEEGKTRLKSEQEKAEEKPDLIQRIWEWIDWYKDDILEKFLKNRAKLLITGRVIKELEELKKSEIGIDISAIDRVIQKYKQFHQKAKQEIEKLYKQDKLLIEWLSMVLTLKNLARKKERIINELYEKDIITPKIYHYFVQEIKRQIYQDIKKLEKV